MPGFNIPNFKFGSCDGQYENEFIEGSYLPNNIETARSCRFRMKIFGLDKEFTKDPYDYFMMACDSIDRPSPKMTSERVWNYNNYVNIPLRLDYDPIYASFYEITNKSDVIFEDNPAQINSTAHSLFSWWTNSVFDFYKLTTHFPNARKQKVTIEHMDGFGDTIWTWLLYNCYPLSIIPDKLDSVSNEISRTQVLLNFDACYEGRSVYTGGP